MGIKFEKKIYDESFEKEVVKKYIEVQSIKKTSYEFEISTRQITNILDKHSIAHNITRKIQMNEEYFDKNDDEIIGNDVMYWAGFIAADGNVMNNSNTRSYFLTIKLSKKDKNHLEQFRKCIQTNATIKDKTHPSKYYLDRYWKKTYSSTIVLNSKYLVNSLTKYNIIPNKTKIYEFPQILKEHKFVNSFIRGYLDGDGSISFKNESLRINFYGTQNCLTNISEVITNECGISIHSPFKNRTIYSLEYNSQDAVLLAKWLYKKQNIYLERKFKLIENLIK